jgi:hypothetical protein
LKKTLIIALFVILGAMTWGFIYIWRSPKYYTLTNECPRDDSILSMAEYGKLVDTHERPFTVAADNVIVFGSEHSRDPNAPFLDLVTTDWAKLKPTVALVEGRLGFFVPGLMNPVEQFGEGGMVADLARGDGAQIYTWDMPHSDLILELVKRFDPEKVAIHQILTPYFSNYRFGPPDHPEAFVSGYLERGWYPGLNGVVQSVADIDRIWQRDFPDQPDWRETSDQYGLPGYLAEISDAANLIRNEHLLCVINELTARGERVFVICGLSHAVCIEPAIGT